MNFLHIWRILSKKLFKLSLRFFHQNLPQLKGCLNKYTMHHRNKTHNFFFFFKNSTQAVGPNMNKKNSVAKKKMASMVNLSIKKKLLQTKLLKFFNKIIMQIYLMGIFTWFLSDWKINFKKFLHSIML